MTPDKRWIAALLAPGLLLALFALLGGGAVWATLDAPQRAVLGEVLASRGMLLVMVALVPWALCAWGLNTLFQRFVAAPSRLLEQAQVRLEGDVHHEIAPIGAAALQGLASTLNQLVRQRSQLREQMAQKVAEASRHIDQERGRLAALMSELTQSVVVCNLDGRILLYNNSARAQFRALSQAPTLAGGAELIGLGRSIYSVFERKLVAHALENIQQRQQRGAALARAQFVTTTPAGQLLRAMMTPVHGGADDTDLHGFVLMLDNITHEFEQESARDQLLHGFTESSRASLGNLQAAVEMVELPDLDLAMRERFHAVIRDEARAMSQRIQDLATRSTQALRTRWPLEDMLGTDFISAARRRIEALPGLRANVGVVDSALWLKVDSFSLLLALASLASRLADEYDLKWVELRLAPDRRAAPGPGPSDAGSDAPVPAGEPAGAAQRAHLDLVWSGQAMSTETVVNWETEPMKIGGETSALSVRDVVQRHGGEFWFERERVRHQAFFRFLLPLAGAQEQLDPASFVRDDGRPEYYDFDLFQASESTRALDDRLLSELAYTVFDTETTGLDPTHGDEIIQIGATRIVAGKLRRQECFEQLVDPQRNIPEAGIAIHGIQPQMLVGQPTIDTVLPAFHAFAQDTVLVAHNAAFDMRFLQMQEQPTGVRFEQPVLDTLLLSAAVHPNQESHGLEAIAERLDVAVTGRHTALGDAMVTAEVFLKLIALLQAQGIRTLGQAREAAQKTYFARVKY
ncbi:MAG TPA: exonuclease domain-containing protein [Rubrivivax sp.]|nr:exonuclease domain-containing protein [Rubrivivax sp.]